MIAVICPHTLTGYRCFENFKNDCADKNFTRNKKNTALNLTKTSDFGYWKL